MTSIRIGAFSAVMPQVNCSRKFVAGTHYMYEQSKAAKRRFNQGAFHQRYFVGVGIDIGGKPDPLSQYRGIFPLMRQVRIWDRQDGDAQYMEEIDDDSFDFLHSSHCLEHMQDVREAMSNWIRIVKPGGYLIITVPDEDLYERGTWPSPSNPDHKWTFTPYKQNSWSPVSINVLELMMQFGDRVRTEKIELIQDFFRQELLARGIDQTLTPVAECAIEIIAQKHA